MLQFLTSWRSKEPLFQASVLSEMNHASSVNVWDWVSVSAAEGAQRRVCVHNSAYFKPKKAERPCRESSLDLKGGRWIHPGAFISFFYRVVKFHTLIKKDGEASGVRSSNESVFISSGGGEASVGGRPSPLLLRAYCWAGGMALI